MSVPPPSPVAPTQRAEGNSTIAEAPTETGSPRDSAVALVQHQRLGGRYEIRGYLGEGGMGAVYRAFDEVLGEEIALKVVRGALATQAALHEEVRMAQRVTHRNVCRTYDLLDIEGRHFIKMEYIPGETLGARIAKSGTLPISEAIRIARAIIEGLAAAHARGIVHRDLKPGNVMLSGERVVLMDFGLARSAGDAQGDRSGTPSYMSPEQLEGGGFDERSDLFALGCLVFEMLAGKRAYELGGGSYSEIVAARDELQIPALRVLRRETPRWLARCVTALMSRDPVHRPRGAIKLRRGPGRARLGFAVAALAIVALAGWWWLRPQTAWSSQIVDVMAYTGNADEASLSPDGKTVLFNADLGHRGKWAVYTVPIEGGEPRRIPSPHQACGYGRWMRDGRAVLLVCKTTVGLSRLYRQPLDGSSAVDLGPGRTGDDCGDAIAVVTNDPNGDQLALRSPDGREMSIARHPVIVSVRCARDGKQIAFVAQRTEHVGGPLMISDRQGHVRQVLGSGVLGGSFTPDGQAMVIAQRTGTTTKLVELDLRGGEIRELTPLEKHARSPDVSLDGRTVMFHRDITSAPLHELGLSGEPEQRTFRNEAFNDLAPVPGADLVIATRTDREPSTIVAITVSSGAARTLVEGDTPFVSTDGRRILFRPLHDPAELRSISIDGGTASVVARFPGAIMGGGDGPDGLHVVIARGDEREAWLVPADGRLPSPEGTTGLVFVAPLGGWRVVLERSKSRRTLRFVAPGQPLSSSSFERSNPVGRPVWVDGQQFSYCDDQECHVLDVVSQTDRVTRPNSVHFDKHLAAASDGSRWFFTSLIAQVTLHKITNFDERPWKSR